MTLYQLEKTIERMKKVGLDAAFETEHPDFLLFCICQKDDPDALIQELTHSYPEFEGYQIENYATDGDFYASKEEEEKARESLKKDIAKWIEQMEWLLKVEYKKEEKENEREWY